MEYYRLSMDNYSTRLTHWTTVWAIVQASVPPTTSLLYNLFYSMSSINNHGCMVSWFGPNLIARLAWGMQRFRCSLSGLYHTTMVVIPGNHLGQLWRARLRVNGKRHNLGRFTTEEAAAEAYNAKALELCEEFAVINII